MEDFLCFIQNACLCCMNPHDRLKIVLAEAR